MIQKLLATLAFVVVAAGMAHAETWRGRLIDATCMDQQQSQQTPAQACNPTATTTAFAINVSGKVYRLDDAGNAKAAEALRNRANREHVARDLGADGREQLA